MVFTERNVSLKSVLVNKRTRCMIETDDATLAGMTFTLNNDGEFTVERHVSFCVFSAVRDGVNVVWFKRKV